MRLGINTGYNVFSYSSAQQVVYIPGDVVAADLSFYYFPVSAALDGDRIYFYVFRTADMSELFHVLWSDKDVVWKRRTVDLSPYAGEYVTLRFGVKNDGLDGVTAAYLDDVELWATHP